MDEGHGMQLGALLGIEVIHVGLVLEVVGIQLAAVQGDVGLHVVGILHDFKIDALFLQDRGRSLENFGMGRRGGADTDCFGSLAGRS